MPYQDVFIRAARAWYRKTVDENGKYVPPRWRLIRTTPLREPGYRSTYVLPATVKTRREAQAIANEWLERGYWPPLAGAGYGGWRPDQHIPGDVWTMKSEGRYRLVHRLPDGKKTTFQLPAGASMEHAEQLASRCLDHHVWPPHPEWVEEVCSA